MYASHYSSQQSGWHRAAGFFAIAIVSVLLGFLLSAPPARAAETPGHFVTANIEKGIAILNDPTLSAVDRQERFRNFLLSISDSKRVAIFTLGSYARSASSAQMDEYVASFTDFVTAIYQKELDAYRDQTIRVTGSIVRSDNDSVVNAEIIAKEAATPPLRIAFRIRKNEADNFVVTDLQVEGVWLALSERSDFTAYLQQHHGDIAALSKELKAKTVQIRSGD